MESQIDLTAGKDALARILEERPAASAHWNEAQNRFHFIDRLLKECLGWSHPYLDVEKSDESGGRSDYLLGNPVQAVLEAKKEQVRFNFPPTTHPRRARKISGLIASCNNFAAAFAQIVPYCSFQGAMVGIICNGPQLVIFRSMTPGQKPSDGLCYVFDGLESYLKNFSTLWSYLSPEGIALNRAKNLLANDGNLRIPPKASTQISEPKKHRFRTPFQENLRTLASVLLDTIEDNEEISDEFDEECYVTTSANKRHLLLSKNAIESRYARSAMSGVETEELRTHNGNLAPSVLLAGRSPRPIVVLGDVGVGKTSFFRHLFKDIDIGPDSPKIYLRVDLGRKATLEEGFKDYLVRELPRKLSSEYDINIFKDEFVSKLYKSELEEFSEGPAGRLKQLDEKEFLLREAAYLTELSQSGSDHLLRSLDELVKSYGKTIFIVIDNADQRDYETQQQAFLAAAELAQTPSVLVFVSLRPSTFYKSKVSGALSGYETKVFTIAPPPAEEVIKKRLTFGLRIAEGKAAPAALEDVRLNLTSIILFLHATLRSIKSNQDIRTFLSNITGGNTRLVIELITSFVGSPNVESEKIAKIEEETGNYKVPLHEFTKHALLGEFAYFHPAASLVAHNIYDTSIADPREHFLKPLIIAFLSSGQASKDRDGYVKGADIFAECRRLGFTDTQSEKALIGLSVSRLIETPHGHYREVELTFDFVATELYFKATSIGVYHLRYWSGTFSFLDAMAIDTPIFDEPTREYIFERADSFRISDRYEKADCFSDYLFGVWNEADFSAVYYDFPEFMKLQRSSFQGVERFLSNNGH